MVVNNDVTELVKQWVTRARAVAMARGEEHPSPPFSRVPDRVFTPLFREASYWHALAAGEFTSRVTHTQPSPESIRAMRERLTRCTAELRTMMDAREDLLPEGTRDQLAVIGHHVSSALEVVEHAHVWERGEAQAWHELSWWARTLDYSRGPGAQSPWSP
ncbi:hypothetical protein [Streptomyces uncialis]|uniref:hypothetical protein n=1 Tax=Streptomyces uncialis TaxID=1048205 RepID=UPI0037934535